MSKLRFRISMSLDGFVAGPRQSVEAPVGVGGMRARVTRGERLEKGTSVTTPEGAPGAPFRR